MREVEEVVKTYNYKNLRDLSKNFKRKEKVKWQ